MASRKAKGDAFRDRIRDLCVAAGYAPLTEKYIQGKKSDVVFEVFSQPRKKLVAVEAKHYHLGLRKSHISELIGDYVLAIQTREVDEVWVISKEGFTTEAQHALEEHPNFYGMSYHAFLKTLIDLRKYIQYLKLLIETDGILSYYVGQYCKRGGQRGGRKITAAEYLIERIAGTAMQPLAVLSTYGMGKTSLAKKIAYECAVSAAKDSTKRIPIYIPLNLLTSQQRIDGLLGALFTSTVSVSGYSFPLFQKLNSTGHFIIFLDGLDEMRHAMTWDDFQYNFRQISELMTPATKIILFGRPNIFKTQEEYDQIIRGASSFGSSVLRVTARRGFDVIDLTPFDVTQTNTYLTNYMSFFLARSGVSATRIQIESRIREIESLKIAHLLARPVHAQMIAEIASDFDEQLTQVSRYRLYNAFVEFVLRRDYYDRSGGAGPSPAERQRILQQIAWVLWFELDKDSFGLNEIIVNVRPRPSEAALRAILAGALLESKYGGIFYFSHRSFQEYLLAEHMLHSRIDWEKFGDRINLLSEEILDFLYEAEDKKSAAQLYKSIESCNIYWDKTVDLAVILYSKLYRKRMNITKNGVASISANAKPTLNSNDRYEPFRLYCHGKMLLRDQNEELLRRVILTAQTRMREDKRYFYYGAQLLVDCLLSRKVFTERYCYTEMIRLVLNWWDKLITEMYYKGKKYFREAQPNVVVISTKRHWGTYVTLSRSAIETAEINPIQFYNSLRAADEFGMRLSARGLSKDTHAINWEELRFVPPLCKLGSMKFGGKVFQFDPESRSGIIIRKRVPPFIDGSRDDNNDELEE